MILFQCKKRGERYRNYPLSVGNLYGRDNTSPFVWACEYAQEGGTGLHATLRLFRLDMESTRGWYEVWEVSATTHMLVLTTQGIFEPNNPIGDEDAISIRMRPIARWGMPNRCSEVPTYSHARVYK